MKPNIMTELKATFDLASLRHEANYLRRPVDWEKARDIRDTHEQERKEQDQKYYSTYESRVESVIKNLINRAGAISKDHKHRWFGNDDFDKAMLSKQAHRLVQQDHQRRMTKINDREAQSLNELVSQVRQRESVRDKPLRDFENARDQESFHVIHHGADAIAPAPPQRHR